MRLPEKRFVIVGGKGGVGRTTVTAALGLAMARRGKKTLLVEMDTAGSISPLFGKSPAAYEPQCLGENLYVVNIDPENAQREYGMMKLRSQTAYKLVFENDLMRRMLRMVPGLRELLLLGKTWFMEQERTPDGRPVWDVIIVDSPATGHGISLFRLPRVILSLFKRGPMAADAKKMLGLLTDEKRTAFHLVTLAEEMPCNESIELDQLNQRVLGIPTGALLINQIWDRSLLKDDATGNLPFQGKDGVGGTVAYLNQRARNQSPFLEKLEEHFGSRCMRLPFIGTQPFGQMQLEELSHSLSTYLDVE